MYRENQRQRWCFTGVVLAIVATTATCSSSTTPPAPPPPTPPSSSAGHGALGIDVGEQSSVVAGLSASGVSVLCNPFGGRATPSAVVFGGRERLVGERTSGGLLTRSDPKLTMTLPRLRLALAGRLSSSAFSSSTATSFPPLSPAQEVAPLLGHLIANAMNAQAEVLGLTTASSPSSLLQKEEELQPGALVVSCPARFLAAQKRALTTSLAIAAAAAATTIWSEPLPPQSLSSLATESTSGTDDDDADADEAEEVEVNSRLRTLVPPPWWPSHSLMSSVPERPPSSSTSTTPSLLLSDGSALALAYGFNRRQELAKEEAETAEAAEAPSSLPSPASSSSSSSSRARSGPQVASFQSMAPSSRGGDGVGGRRVVAFVDLGHSGIQVTVAVFSSKGCQVIAHSWDETVGGGALDDLVFNMCVDKIEAQRQQQQQQKNTLKPLLPRHRKKRRRQGGEDGQVADRVDEEVGGKEKEGDEDKGLLRDWAGGPLNRAGKRLMDACVKAKVTLSANTEAVVAVESLLSDNGDSGSSSGGDVRVVITRSELESALLMLGKEKKREQGEQECQPDDDEDGDNDERTTIQTKTTTQTKHMSLCSRVEAACARALAIASQSPLVADAIAAAASSAAATSTTITGEDALRSSAWLHSVELVGGSAYVPCLRAAVARAFGDDDIDEQQRDGGRDLNIGGRDEIREGRDSLLPLVRQTMDPLESVANGCALRAAQILAQRDAEAAATAAAAAVAATRTRRRRRGSGGNEASHPPHPPPLLPGGGMLRVAPYSLTDCTARPLLVKAHLPAHLPAASTPETTTETASSAGAASSGLVPATMGEAIEVGGHDGNDDVHHCSSYVVAEGTLPAGTPLITSSSISSISGGVGGGVVEIPVMLTREGQHSDGRRRGAAEMNGVVLFADLFELEAKGDNNCGTPTGTPGQKKQQKQQQQQQQQQRMGPSDPSFLARFALTSDSGVDASLSGSNDVDSRRRSSSSSGAHGKSRSGQGEEEVQPQMGLLHLEISLDGAGEVFLPSASFTAFDDLAPLHTLPPSLPFASNGKEIEDSGRCATNSSLSFLVLPVASAAGDIGLDRANGVVTTVLKKEGEGEGSSLTTTTTAAATTRPSSFFGLFGTSTSTSSTASTTSSATSSSTSQSQQLLNNNPPSPSSPPPPPPQSPPLPSFCSPALNGRLWWRAISRELSLKQADRKATEAREVVNSLEGAMLEAKEKWLTLDFEEEMALQMEAEENMQEKNEKENEEMDGLGGGNGDDGSGVDDASVLWRQWLRSQRRKTWAHVLKAVLTATTKEQNEVENEVDVEAIEDAVNQALPLLKSFMGAEERDGLSGCLEEVEEWLESEPLKMVVAPPPSISTKHQRKHEEEPKEKSSTQVITEGKALLARLGGVGAKATARRRATSGAATQAATAVAELVGAMAQAEKELLKREGGSGLARSGGIGSESGSGAGSGGSESGEGGSASLGQMTTPPPPPPPASTAMSSTASATRTEVEKARAWLLSACQQAAGLLLNPSPSNDPLLDLSLIPLLETSVLPPSPLAPPSSSSSSSSGGSGGECAQPFLLSPEVAALHQSALLKLEEAAEKVRAWTAQLRAVHEAEDAAVELHTRAAAQAYQQAGAGAIFTASTEQQE